MPAGWRRAFLRVTVIVLLACGVDASPARADRTIDRAERVPVDGATLFLLTRGRTDGPILLWLHGGPGGAERPLFRYFNGALEERFAVAYLDQRGTGRSLDDDADPRLLTIARHEADLDAVVDHLRRELGREKVVLIGHSWGGALGMLYAYAHPEKVTALVAVAPLVSTRAAEVEQDAFVRATATSRDDERTLAKLREIGPPPYASASQALAADRLAEGYGAVFHREPNRTWVVASGIVRGLVTPWEIPRLIRGNERSLVAMHDELLGLDLTRAVPALEVPVVFVLGRYDCHVSAEVAAAYFATLRAPAKRLVWFEESAHNPPFEEPRRFNEMVPRALAALGVAD